MKKILFILITIFYIFMSFTYIKVFSFKQVNQMLYNNTYKIEISSWNHTLKSSEIFNSINAFSKKQNINIYKVNYNNSNYLHQNISINASVGNIKALNQKFNMKITSENSLVNFKIKLFDKNISMDIKKMNSNNIPVEGIYYVNGANYNINVVAKYFKSIGLNISSISYVSSFNSNKPLNENLKLVVIVLTLLISLTISYYAISKYKEFAIKKLFGFTNKKIFLYFLEEILQVYVVAFLVAFSIIIIYLCYFNRFLYVVDYLSFWIINIGLISIILFICNIPSYLLLLKININNMIKNKKPHLIIQLISYVTKVIFSIIYIYMVINIFNSYLNLNVKYSDNGWQVAKKYCYLEYNSSYMTTIGSPRYYQETIESEKLFKKLSLSGALLIKPSTGDFLENQHIKSRSFQKFGSGPCLSSGNSITVNSHYLKLNPIYNINNEVINIHSFNNTNEIQILVPEMYKSQENLLLKSYEKWYYNAKYANKIYHYKEMGKKLPKLKPVKVKITFIKNNQKEFLYNTRLENKMKGYSINAVIAVVNPYNLGGDRYLSYLTGGYMMPYIGGENGWVTLNNQLKSLNINKYIIGMPSVYSKMSSYIYEINKQINFDYYLLILLILTELIVLIFIALNYIEKNKYINAVKYIHGYSYLKLYKYYLLSILILWGMVDISAIFLYSQYWLLIIIISGVFCIFEMMISLFVFKLYLAKQVKNILKGE
ncbi:MAG: DUF1430 domain-containing protein [Sarcina sp.]